MALTPQIITENLRQRLGLRDASDAARYLIGIPEALKATARKVAANSNLRPLMVTDPVTTTLPLVAGAGDLTELYVNNRVMLEYIDKGQIYHTTYPYPLRRIPVQTANFPQQLDAYGYYYIRGDRIFAQSNVPAALTGELSFAVPAIPLNVGALTESEEVETIFFDKLFEWAMSNQDPQNDAAEDGDK